MIEALRLCSDGAEFFPEALEILKVSKQQSPQYGKIFHQSDYKFYKGVLYFYLGNYEKAIRNIEKAEKQTRLEQLQAGMMESEHFEKLNFDGSGTFNLYEYLYNLALCHIMNGNLMKALKCLKSILERNLSERVKH